MFICPFVWHKVLNLHLCLLGLSQVFLRFVFGPFKLSYLKSLDIRSIKNVKVVFKMHFSNFL